MSKSIIHYFAEFDQIKIIKGKINKSIIIKVLCGATTGEADNRKKYVTCSKCKQIMK